jgi:steroid delta-isomerase-like uncharacterized protein
MLLAGAISVGVPRFASGQEQHEHGGRHGDLALRWADAWNSHDADAVAALFARDGFFEDVTFGVVAHGTNEIRAVAQSFFTVVPDLHISVVNGSFNASRGSIEWVFSGSDQGLYRTGKTFAVRGATVLELAENKISRDSDYWDLATLLRQIGLMPPGL